MGQTLLPEDLAKPGLIAVDLAAGLPEWVRRRKTTFRFVDDATVHNRMSVDVVLPPRSYFIGEAPEDGETIYLPLLLSRKESLVGLDITDQGGQALSLLNSYENGLLITSGYEAIVSDRFREVVRSIVTAEDGSSGVEAHERATADGLDEELAGTAYQALLRDLARYFMMLTPVEYKEGGRHLIKVDWVADIQWRKSGFGGWWRATQASWGLADKPIDLPALELGAASGTHFEIVRPDDVEILRSTLATTRPGSSPQVVGPAPQLNLNTRVADRADPLSSRDERGDIEITLRPVPSGAFLAVTVLSVLTCVVIWAIALALPDLDVQTMSAVVLLFPAVVAAFLVRPGEHAIASKLLAGVRIGGLAIAVCAFVAAVAIGVSSSGSTDVASAHATVNCGALPSTGASSWGGLGWQCLTTSLATTFPTASASQSVVIRMAEIATILALLLVAGVVNTWWAVHTARREFNHDVPQTDYPG